MKEDLLYLVNENDQPIGEMSKLEVHQKGLLHRAFSVYVFKPNGYFLLQQRAIDKYHSGARWSNSCCSHPRVGESLMSAYKRRLDDENGIKENNFRSAGSLIYWAEVPPLIEYEFLHLAVTITNQEPVLNPKEAMNYQWVNWEDLKKDVKENPFKYSAWFNIIMNSTKYRSWIEQAFQQALLDYQT